VSVLVRERTPRGAGAVSVVAFEGPGALERVRALTAGAALAPGDTRLVRVVLDDQVVDEALAVCLATHHVELHLHGSPPLVRELLATAPPAPVGSESLEARAARALENAPCESAARILLDQSEGALRAALEQLMRAQGAESRALAGELARRGRIARYALEPALVVLAGRVNAGKSTLFNLLAGEERALVADEPGTTRDIVAADALLGAWPVRLLDTAGDRTLAKGAQATIEAEGQRRARRAREAADIVLWLAPVGTAADAPVGSVTLNTQADRVRPPPPGAISALVDPDGARARVGEILRARFALPLEPWTPGLAVPFESSQCDALDALARGAIRAADASRDLLAARDDRRPAGSAS